MTPTEIREIVSKAAKEAVELFPRFSGHVADVKFFSKGVVAGKAWRHLNILEFNTVLAERAGLEFTTTIYHEVAHLVVNEVYPRAKQAHGPEFRYVMQMLGKSGRTYHKYDVSGLKRTYNKNPTKYVYVCNCSEHHLSPLLHKRISRGQQRRCNCCGGVIKYTGKVVQ
jgi:SprT protein